MMCIFTLLVLSNLEHTMEDAQRFLLSSSDDKNRDERGNVLLNDGGGRDRRPYGTRFLSRNLGNGNCKWTAPEKLDISEQSNTTTLLASYPGSGKRQGTTRMIHFHFLLSGALNWNLLIQWTLLQHTDWHGEFWKLLLVSTICIS